MTSVVEITLFSPSFVKNNWKLGIVIVIRKSMVSILDRKVV